MCGGGGGYAEHMSIRGCAANMGSVFSKFSTFMGHKFAYYPRILAMWYIDGFQIASFAEFQQLWCIDSPSIRTFSPTTSLRSGIVKGPI